MNTLTFIGILGGVSSLIGYIPYARSVIEGKVQPERASWLIWTLSNVLLLLSYYAIGARTTIWLPLAYVIGSAFITGLSFRYGKEGWSTFEKLVFAVAILSAIRWVYFDNPLFALIANLVVGFIGYMPKIVHPTSDRYQNESFLAWGFYFIGSVFNVIAVSPWTPVIYVVPVTMLVMNGAVFGIKLASYIRSKNAPTPQA